MILYIQHEAIEGPEKLGEFFDAKGFERKTVILPHGDRLPGDLAGIQAVVSLGGPMNVYEEEKYPFLKDEDEFIRRVVKEKVPFLGVCLGAQLLAKAFGAKVKKSLQPEIGFFKADLNSSGMEDPLFDRLPYSFEVFQWHNDMFEIPEKAKWLAVSKACPYQALRVGLNAYGVQFHVEVREKNIREWSELYWKSRTDNYRDEVKRMVDEYHKRVHNLEQTAQIIFENFHKLILTARR
ncbi:MAG: type 1 glutamine amidotransferase [Candidatus Omnitrophica bacterium]|nr:type 1 glutamine amidotransferase [Candidatus Omnitrophota bacterium]